MRLYKFLVISNEVRDTYFIEEIRINDKGRLLRTNNTFYKIRQDLLECKSLNLIFMSIYYPNESSDFNEENEAYLIMDSDDIENVMELISPIKTGLMNFAAIGLDMIPPKVAVFELYNKYVRGRPWNFHYDTTGKRVRVQYKFKGIDIEKNVDPKTGGIAYSALQFRKNERPKEFLNKTVTVPIHHWIISRTIPKKKITNGEKLYYHIGHIFDNRKDYIACGTKVERDSIRKNIEPEKGVYRGLKITPYSNFFGNSLEECDYEAEAKNKHLKSYSGALWIQNRKQLENLIEQLISIQYSDLKRNH